MKDAVPPGETRDIVVDEVFPHAPEALWKALTSAVLMARWLMPPKDFEPVEGKHFTFQTTPAGAWDGIIRCEVLEVVPNERLTFAWKGGDAANAGYGSRLDTIVTFTLARVDAGTRLRLVHSGFVPSKNDTAFKNLGDGWRLCFGRLGAAVTGESGLSSKESAMTTHPTATREEWLAARLALLEDEKALTRQSDALARRRRALPWVRLDKAYRFETDDGPATLVDLFGGRSQLLVYHFMFGPTYKAGCPSCSAIADGFDGIAVHLANHDVALWAVSRAPLAALRGYKRRLGWSFPWASSEGGDFNPDFNVWFSEAAQREGRVEYNYRREAAMARREVEPGTGGAEDRFASSCGTDTATYQRERPGLSAFALEDGAVYHTYSTYARGLDALWGMYQWLDRAPKGRNETGGLWWRRNDEYGPARWVSEARPG